MASMEFSIVNPVVGAKSVDGKSASILLTSQVLEQSEESLLHFFQTNQNLTIFARLTGILWEYKQSFIVVKSLQYFWNFVIRIGLMTMIVYGVFLVWAVGEYFIFFARPFFVIVAIIVVLQSGSLFFGLYDIHRRLTSKPYLVTVVHLTSCLKVAYISMFISLVTFFIPIYYIFDLGAGLILSSVYGLGQLSVCLVLTVAMYFITLDCTVARSLLEQVLQQLELKMLTIEQYSRVEAIVMNCQASSSWINNALVFIALLDVAAILILLFFTGLPVGEILVMLGLLLKEIPFIVVVYWQVAQVNEKFAKFLKEISRAQWDIETGEDNRRMAIYIRAQGNPIVMSIAGMKLKRADLAWQLALWCLALAFSVGRAVVLKKAESSY